MLGIEAGATADQSDTEIETAYNNRVAHIIIERTAGDSTPSRDSLLLISRA